MVIYPSMMDASKQLGTLSPGKWLTFRKTSQSDQAFQSKIGFGMRIAALPLFSRRRGQPAGGAHIDHTSRRYQDLRQWRRLSDLEHTHQSHAIGNRRVGSKLSVSKSIDPPGSSRHSDLGTSSRLFNNPATRNWLTYCKEARLAWAIQARISSILKTC